MRGAVSLWRMAVRRTGSGSRAPSPPRVCGALAVFLLVSSTLGDFVGAQPLCT